MLAHSRVTKGLDVLRADDAQTLADQKALVTIAAPPFHEQARAEHYRSRLAALGLNGVHIDQEGNAIGVRPGAGGGPKLVVAAHLDTVFPEGTDLTIREKDGKLYAPGIGDDTRGLADLSRAQAHRSRSLPVSPHPSRQAARSSGSTSS
jgi:tripeptide aminopeptidase